MVTFAMHLRLETEEITSQLHKHPIKLPTIPTIISITKYHRAPPLLGSTILNILCEQSNL